MNGLLAQILLQPGDRSVSSSHLSIWWVGPATAQLSGAVWGGRATPSEPTSSSHWCDWGPFGGFVSSSPVYLRAPVLGRVVALGPATTVLPIWTFFGLIPRGLERTALSLAQSRQSLSGLGLGQSSRSPADVHLAIHEQRNRIRVTVVGLREFRRGGRRSGL